MSLEDIKLGFIGGGNMARAIVEGILKKGLVKNSQIMVSSPSNSTIALWKAISIPSTHSNSEVVKFSDIIFLTFKPNQLDNALEYDPTTKSSTSKLFVSVLAGTPSQYIIDKLIKNIQPDVRLIRVMPNTPVKVCEGCTVISPHNTATETDVSRIKEIFSAVGKCEVVPEYLISGVTGLTGSGPAYVYLIIEALSDGAVKQGLPRSLATHFAAQMVLGSAKMVLETSKHPATLKDEVCSAAGTTIYGIHELEKGSLRGVLMNAVEAAVHRGDELRNMTGK